MKQIREKQIQKTEGVRNREGKPQKKLEGFQKDETKLQRGTEENESCNYTYIVRCRDGSLYTGWTNHLEERIRAHNEGRGAKYTRSRGPVELVYWETFATKQEAMSREVKIKRLTKAQKEALIKQSILERGGL